METSDNDEIIPSLKTLVEIYSKDRYNFTNTGLIQFMATLEKLLFTKVTSFTEAFLGVNSKVIEINVSPTVVNSFLTEVANIVNYNNNYYINGNFNLDSFNAKHDTLNIYDIFKTEISSLKFQCNVKLDKDYNSFNTNYAKDLLLGVLGYDNYIKLLIVLNYIYK